MSVLESIRSDKEVNLEPLLVMPHRGGVLVLLESQAGIYRLHDYGKRGRSWHCNLIANPTGNLREVYKEINRFLAEQSTK